MAVYVKAAFVFTEDDFEILDFYKKAEIVERMLNSSDFDVEIQHVFFEDVNMEDEFEDEDA